MKTTEFDVVIVGGGFVGATLALALQQTSLQVALVESGALETDGQPGFDDRGIALAYGSQRILQTLQLWPDLAQYACEIIDIHISDKGHFGVTRLSAAEQGVPALGQVITAKAMGQVLNKHLLTSTSLSLFCPNSVIALETNLHQVNIALDDQSQLSAKLVVAADGQFSHIRQLLDLGTQQTRYGQTAITGNIVCERPHNHRAFERFTDTGPIALLPMTQQRMSLVWTVKDADVDSILAMDDARFLQSLQQRFGYRLGKFLQIGERQHYPLSLMRVDAPVQPRTVLIGNAAHSVHPVAGQGFNLGLRDVAVLAEMLAEQTGDCGDARLLHDYQQQRQPDQDKVINNTDRLVKIFSNHNPILGHGRASALSLLNMLPPLKRCLANTSMGLAGRQAKLSRGLPL